MESILKHVLKSYFDEYVEGLDRNIDCSELPVNIRNLKIKDKRIREEMEDSAFEFTDGTIGRVQMHMSWRGQLEVLADNIVLKFTFYPMKAMKKALLPEAWQEKAEEEEEEKEDKEDDEENQVPLDIQRRLATPPPQAASQLGQLGARGLQPQLPLQRPVQPRFCSAHQTSEKRPKVEPHTFECESCRMQLQTNYAEAKLCPACSEKDGRCMCCGAPAPPPGAVPSVLAREGTPTGMPTPAMMQQTPLFCQRHSTSECRPKVDPQERECKSCQAKLQTNYAEFSICPACSRRDNRCLICGASVDQSPATAVHSTSSVATQELPPPPPCASCPSTLSAGGLASVQRLTTGPWKEDSELEHEKCLPPPPPPLVSQDYRGGSSGSQLPPPPPPSQQSQMLPQQVVPPPQRPPPAPGPNSRWNSPAVPPPVSPPPGMRPADQRGSSSGPIERRRPPVAPQPAPRTPPLPCGPPEPRPKRKSWPSSGCLKAPQDWATAACLRHPQGAPDRWAAWDMSFFKCSRLEQALF